MKLPAIDKQAHYFSGWAGAATVFPIIGWWSMPLIAALAWAKEEWDKRGHGTYDPWDFMASLSGGVTGAVLAYIAGGF